MIVAFAVSGCNTVDKNIENTNVSIDTTAEESVVKNVAADSSRVYANERFKDVRVKRLGGNNFQISGKAQIFEANFSWVIEDGHNELQQGHQTTDAGAPEWGNFNFTVDAAKQNEQSTLHLILFEASAEDGSRQHELPILLY